MIINNKAVLAGLFISFVLLYLLFHGSYPSSSSLAPPSEDNPTHPSAHIPPIHSDPSSSPSSTSSPSHPTSTETNANKARAPRIDYLYPTVADNDTSADWDDDDGKLRYVTLLWKPTIDTLQNIRRFVGSVHDFEKEQIKVTVFGVDVHEDFYEEVRTFSYLRYIKLHSEQAKDEQAALAHIITECKRLYADWVFVPISEKYMLKAGGLAKAVESFSGAGAIKVSYQGKESNMVGHIHGDTSEGMSVNGDEYFTIGDGEDHGRCSLFRNITSNFRTKFVYAKDNENFIKKEDRHHPEDRLVCLAIATYSGGSHGGSVSDFALFKQVLPTFLDTTNEVDTPSTRYRFAMYLGVQRDPFFDNNMQEVIRIVEDETFDRSFSLRVFYTPLNAPALDITYKWNVLIDQTYRDGCDYIYQYSDDTQFSTPWVDQFVRYLEAESNFGVVGATDSNNPGIMTLSFSHRNHISIIGSYWPTHLKNWWSDNWAQHVYGDRYTLHSSEVKMRNTQQHGQRYPACGSHGELYERLMKDESRPRIIAWLKKQPPTYDIRQKIAYFEAGANGAKKK